jgi:hypothetical protein
MKLIKNSFSSEIKLCQTDAVLLLSFCVGTMRCNKAMHHAHRSAHGMALALASRGKPSTEAFPQNGRHDTEGKADCPFQLASQRTDGGKARCGVFSRAMTPRYTMQFPRSFPRSHRTRTSSLALGSTAAGSPRRVARHSSTYICPLRSAICPSALADEIDHARQCC